MLKKKVTELLDRYESGEQIMTAVDLANELDEIINTEPYEKGLTDDLQEAIDIYSLARYDYIRFGGHGDDGAYRFIHRVKTYAGHWA